MTTATPARLDPEGLFASLAERRIDYVLIGAFAAVLHGSPLLTQDIDICPSATDDNIHRLASFLLIDARALWETTAAPIGATVAEASERLVRGEGGSFGTRFGRLDVVFRPAGTDGHPDLVRDASEFRVGDSIVAVASLRDVIRSKESAGRDVDVAQLPVLRKLLERLESS